MRLDCEKEKNNKKMILLGKMVGEKGIENVKNKV